MRSTGPLAAVAVAAAASARLPACAFTLSSTANRRRPTASSRRADDSTSQGRRFRRPTTDGGGGGSAVLLGAASIPTSDAGSDMGERSGLEGGFRKEGGAESVGLTSNLGGMDIGADIDMQSIVDDGHGHINAELAQVIWEWENDHLLNMTDAAAASGSGDGSSTAEDKFPAANIKFSTRAGLRIVDDIARELLSLHSDPSSSFASSPSSSTSSSSSLPAPSAATASASGVSYADLIQDGVVALLRALAKFDPAKPEDFEGFSRRKIYRAMERSVADAASRPLRLPGKVHETLRRAKAESAKLRSELGREPTVPELAAAVHVTPERLRFYQLTARSSVPVENTVEIYDPNSDPDVPAVFADEDAYESMSGKDEALLHSGEAEILEEEEEWVEPHDKIVAPLRDFIPDTTSPDPDDVVLTDMIRSDVDDLLRKTLDDRELQIVMLKFGLDGTNNGRGMSYAEIGERMGLSRQRVAQIELRALDKLRTSYSSAFVELYLDDDHSEEVSV